MSIRQKVYRFLELPFYIKIQIAKEFGLIEKGDVDLPDKDLFELIFKRAVDRKCIDDLFSRMETIGV